MNCHKRKTKKYNKTRKYNKSRKNKSYKKYKKTFRKTIKKAGWGGLVASSPTILPTFSNPALTPIPTSIPSIRSNTLPTSSWNNRWIKPTTLTGGPPKPPTTYDKFIQYEEDPNNENNNNDDGEEALKGISPLNPENMIDTIGHVEDFQDKYNGIVNDADAMNNFKSDYVRKFGRLPTGNDWRREKIRQNNYDKQAELDAFNRIHSSALHNTALPSQQYTPYSL